MRRDETRSAICASESMTLTLHLYRPGSGTSLRHAMAEATMRGGEMRADDHGWNEAVGVKLLIALASWPHRSEEATASRWLLPLLQVRPTVVLCQLSARAVGRWWAVPACTMIWNDIEAVKVGPDVQYLTALVALAQWPRDGKQIPLLSFALGWQGKEGRTTPHSC